MLIENKRVETETLFAKVTFKIKLNTPGHMELHEFRSAVKAFGFTGADADRVFSYLDHQGGNHHNPPATVTVADFDWLRRLPALVDIEAVLLSGQDNLNEQESLRLLHQMGTLPNRTRQGYNNSPHNQMMRKNSRFDLKETKRRSTSP